MKIIIKIAIKLNFYFDIYFDMIGFRYRINMIGVWIGLYLALGNDTNF